MKITDLSIRRPVGVAILFTLVVLVGLLSLNKLKLDLYPNIQFPIVAVSTNYPGAGSEEIETIITRPLEEAVAAVPNIETVTSFSAPEASIIIAEANYGADMDYISLTIRERIDLVKPYFPDDVSAPIVFKFDPSMMPMMFVGVSGGHDLELTTKIIEDRVKPRLESIGGVASVSVNGGLTREFRVEVDPKRLLAYGLTLSQIEQALVSENLNMPGGTTQQGKTELYIRSIGAFKSLQDLKDLRLTLPGGGSITLSEVATVVDDYEEQKTKSRLNGRPGLMLNLQKESDANTVLVARAVREELAALHEELGEAFNYQIVIDQAEFIESSIKTVVENGIIGALLAALILWLFLRNLRSTLVISISIPISIITTFTMIYFKGMTLNMISLGGLALGVGMLVDNAIVVLENIYRFRQEGYDRISAAREGTSEVAMAITASTLTTMVVFLPILFVEGITAQIFNDMALTVVFSLGASLLVALTLVPMLSSKLLAISKAARLREDEDFAGESRLGRVQAFYRRVLSKALHHRKTTVILAFICFILAFVPFFTGLKMEFMPASLTGEVIISFELPVGWVLSETDQICRRFEEYLFSRPEVETVSTSVGSTGFGFSPNDPNEGSIRVKLKDEHTRFINDFMEEIRVFAATMPEITATVSGMHGGGMGSGSPIEYEISGPDLQMLAELGTQVKDIIASVEGTREVTTSLDEGRPEVHLKINREKANLFGISGAMIASTVRTAYQGSAPTKMRLAGNEYDIRVILKEEDRKNVEDLKYLMLLTPTGSMVPLGDIADIQVTTGPTQIQRKHQTRYVTVSADLYQRDQGSVKREIDQLLAEELVLPPQYNLTKGGQVMEMEKSFGDLTNALLAAILCVYMVMAIQYESLLHPFTILLSIPLMFFGVTWSLYLTNRPLNVVGLIGLIMLAGIVVNNAIVLVDYIETLRNRGMDRRSAVLMAGPTRLRPVLMTTLTTILGMFPLALGIGEGAELEAPLATVIIGGLTFSTLLTLVVIPVLYTLMDDFGLFLRRIFRRDGAAKAYTR
ncbi:MAG TPA: efflux RND transporter permease subunit [Firmicutes bacterium]|nr:efflux RND transporter permease subunit [Bacillota bacterium]